MRHRCCSRGALVKIALLFFCCLSVTSAAQHRPAWQFPAELRPQLDSRLKLFLSAQAEGRWDYVSLLLGDYRRSAFVGYMRYTKEHKDCLVSQMKSYPMIQFDYTVDQSSYSSEILSTPPGRRWWTLVGEGTFRLTSETVKRKTMLIAYRDKGDWYFTPFNYNDDASARAHLTEEDLSRDRKDEVKLLLPPDCPVDIVDLHVFIDPKDLKIRHVHFRLHNRTNELITQYGFVIDDEHQNGSISFGTGAAKDALEPGGFSRDFDEDDVAYTYWCEGEAKMRIQVDHVHFADGRDWNAPAPQKSKRKLDRR